MRRISGLALILLVAAFVPGPALGGGEPAAKNLSGAQLTYEVIALRALHQFQFTPEQLRSLGECAGKPPLPHETNKKLSDNLRKTLEALHQAFLKEEDNRISELEDELENLQDKEKFDWELDIPITENARRQVATLRRLLSARQVAAFLALYEDDFPDPMTEMLQALEKVPEVKAGDWKTFCANTAELVGRLVAGLDPDRIRKVEARVKPWLERAKSLSPEELKKRQPDLENEARQIVAGVDPVDVIRNLIDHSLAELLSNPRLPNVLAALEGEKK